MVIPGDEEKYLLGEIIQVGATIRVNTVILIQVILYLDNGDTRSSDKEVV